jgi:hypothetical protein
MLHQVFADGCYARMIRFRIHCAIKLTMLSVIVNSGFLFVRVVLFPLGPGLLVSLHKFRQTSRLGPDPNLDATEAALDSPL